MQKNRYGFSDSVVLIGMTFITSLDLKTWLVHLMHNLIGVYICSKVLDKYYPDTDQIACIGTV